MGVAISRSASLLSALVFVLSCAVAGCDFVQTPTLASIGELVFDDSLVGEWVSTSFQSEPIANTNVRSRMQVVREGDGYRALTRDGDGEIKEWRFQLYQIGELLVAEVTVGVGSTQGEWLTLVAVARNDETLGLRFLSGEWADNHLIANRSMMGCLVRSSAEDLIETIADAGIEAFPGPTNGYTRVTSNTAE